MLVEAALNISMNTELQSNLREATINFLEELGEENAKFMVKRNPSLIQKIIAAGFTIAAEDTEEKDEQDNTLEFALYLLYKYASEVPNPVAWPLFKANIKSAWDSANPLARRACLKVLGFVSESDALLDCIKDDIDELTELLVMALKDPDSGVRDAAALTTAEFADNVVPDFLEMADKVLPCLLDVLTQRLEAIFAQSSGGPKTSGDSAEKALLALAEFTANMDMD